MKITFCGAAGTVTGSCHLIELESGKKILLDCGLYQGREEEFKKHNHEWPFNPSEIDFLILSHAHIDHSGRIPKLVKDGFLGDIISTSATRDLCAIMLMDSAMIQEQEAKHIKRKKIKNELYAEPLYTRKDAKASLSHFVGISYDHWLKIDEGIRIIFQDTGHILGSASVVLEIGEASQETIRLGFTGDIGRPNRPILKDPMPMIPVDYLICESTYGGKEHQGMPQDEKALYKVIKDTCIKKKGKLIIPAFSIGRSQELVYMIDRMETAGKLNGIPVYVDSPLAVNATDIFRLHPECYDDEILDYMMKDPNPFGFNDLHFIRKRKASQKLNDLKGPAIIISASGMMQAGRIKHHLLHNVEDPKNTILVVGYTSKGTLGRDIRNRTPELKIFGTHRKLNAEVVIMDSFSAHADHSEILEFLTMQDKDRLRKIFLVHGEIDRQIILKEDLLTKGFKEVIIPEYGNTFLQS